MPDNDLRQLGQNIARLRAAQKLKQSELAYEAGVSVRTLQRIEAGDVVKTDGLLKVVRELGRLDELLSAVSTASFSPNQLAHELKSGARKSAESTGAAAFAVPNTRSRKTRVRTSAKDRQRAGDVPDKIVWPEDQS